MYYSIKSNELKMSTDFEVSMIILSILIFSNYFVQMTLKSFFIINVQLENKNQEQT
jgi:hypothetical protein